MPTLPRKNVWCENCSQYYNMPAHKQQPDMCPECKNRMYERLRKEKKKQRQG